MAGSDRLDVWFGTERVGSIHDTSPLSFEYEPSWLQRPEKLTIASIALVPGLHDAPTVAASFENLLPEGELRQYLIQQRKASTLFALLREVAGDTSGGFVVVNGGEVPAAPSYEPTSWQALANTMGRQSAAAIDIRGKGARMSLAGAQDKTGVAIFDDGRPCLPVGVSPSTHILKPDIRRLAKVWHSAANEAIVMRAAMHCGLPTADVFYEPLTGSCVVQRFDRALRPDGSLARLIQYDMCQLGGITSDRKYEKEGGPGLAACAALVRQFSAQPAIDLRHLVSWVFFNLYVGNDDGHAKNLSIYHVPGRGTGLTPFYDLMCTRLYPGLSREFAFAIGGEFNPSAMTRTHVDALAEQLGMRPRFLVDQARDVARKVPGAVTRAMAEIEPSLSHSAKVLARRLQQFIHSTSRKLSARLTS